VKLPSEETEKEVIWLGSSLEDLKDMPLAIRKEVGYVLGGVQKGEFDKSIKSLKGLSGVYEIRADYDSDTYRAVYVVNLSDVIYVLHVFKKKSKQGSETPKRDMDLIRSRLKAAKEDADEREASKKTINKRKN
jgi:phage-related protein